MGEEKLYDYLFTLDVYKRQVHYCLANARAKQ